MGANTVSNNINKDTATKCIIPNLTYQSSNSVYVTYITKLDKIRTFFEDETEKPINLRNYNGLYSYSFFIKTPTPPMRLDI